MPSVDLSAITAADVDLEAVRSLVAAYDEANATVASRSVAFHQKREYHQGLRAQLSELHAECERRGRVTEADQSRIDATAERVAEAERRLDQVQAGQRSAAQLVTGFTENLPALRSALVKLNISGPALDGLRLGGVSVAR